MNSFAAIMIIVACPSAQASCIDKPVTVISYHQAVDCRSALPAEIRKAKRFVDQVLGDCVPVNPSLLVGSGEIRQVLNGSEISALTGMKPVAMEASALQPQIAEHRIPVPLKRYDPEVGQ